MEFLPEFGIGILYGWIYFVVYLIVFGITMQICPEDVRKRLYDRSLWDKKTKIITAIGKSFSLLNILMILFGKIQLGNLLFLVGNGVFIIGLTMLVTAIINYKNAPLNEPITNGLYKYSRNPQMVALYILFTGMILIIGAWLNLIFLGISILCSHFSILGEENALEKQYGESYKKYRKKVPRYFLFF